MLLSISLALAVALTFCMFTIAGLVYYLAVMGSVLHTDERD